MTSQHPQLSSLLSFLSFENGTNHEEESKESHQHLVQQQTTNHDINGNENSNQVSNTEDHPRDPTLASSSNNNKKSSSTTFEKATIVYHESAQSIVFRDHLRRAQKAASAQKDSDNTSISGSRPKSNASHVSNASSTTHEHIKPSPPTPTPTAIPETTPSPHKIKGQHKVASFKDDVSIISNSSKMSHDQSSYLGTTNHTNYTDSGASIASSLETDAEADIETDAEKQQLDDHHRHGTNSHHDDRKPQVIIANYTPRIDPLPPLALEAHNEFSELLLSNPYMWRDGEGPEEAVRNSVVWNTMSEKEREVAEQLLEQTCAVKTIKNADLTTFIQKFPVKEDEGQVPRRWLHPADFKDASKKERMQKYEEGGDVKFHSFHTSLSLLPPLGLKMRCYGSTRSYTSGVIFALPPTTLVSNKVEDEDIALRRTHTWAWPAGYAAKTEFNISHRGELINGRKEALVSITQLRSNNHSYIYDKDYGKFLIFSMACLASRHLGLSSHCMFFR